MPDPSIPTLPPPDPSDALKPWFARSIFSGAVLKTVGTLLVVRRLGWDGPTDEGLLELAGMWILFFSFLKASPSRPA